MITNTTVPGYEATRGVRLILPDAIIRRFEAKVEQRKRAGLPYKSPEDLLELWIVDVATQEHPIPNPYGEQIDA